MIKLYFNNSNRQIFPDKQRKKNDKQERQKIANRKYYRKRSRKKLYKEKTVLNEEVEHYRGCYNSTLKMYRNMKKENIKLELANNKLIE